MNKYRSKKITVGGVTFDSKKEAKRWQELVMLQNAWKISNLQRQVKFELLPSQYAVVATGKGTKRRCIERPVHYVADFVYLDQNGKRIVEDTKGYRTKDYILKRKMMLYFHNIQITEI